MKRNPPPELPPLSAVVEAAAGDGVAVVGDVVPEGAVVGKNEGMGDPVAVRGAAVDVSAVVEPVVGTLVGANDVGAAEDPGVVRAAVGPNDVGATTGNAVGDTTGIAVGTRVGVRVGRRVGDRVVHDRRFNPNPQAPVHPEADGQVWHESWELELEHTPT